MRRPGPVRFGRDVLDLDGDDFGHAQEGIGRERHHGRVAQPRDLAPAVVGCHGRDGIGGGPLQPLGLPPAPASTLATDAGEHAAGFRADRRGLAGQAGGSLHGGNRHADGRGRGAGVMACRQIVGERGVIGSAPLFGKPAVEGGERGAVSPDRGRGERGAGERLGGGRQRRGGFHCTGGPAGGRRSGFHRSGGRTGGRIADAGTDSGRAGIGACHGFGLGPSSDKLNYRK